MFLVVRRASLLIPSGPPHDREKRHLFVCLTDPHGPLSEVAIVSISSARSDGRHDQTCRLFPGDHQFIIRESFVDYRHARIIEAGKLNNGVQSGRFERRQPFDIGIFARICDGILKSRYTERRIADFYRSTLPPEPDE